MKIPDKRYFKISEVSAITGLEAHVLRFWESEFGKIRPKRTDSGQRMYRKKDIEYILEIKNLLHDRKFTIKGARQLLETSPEGKEKPQPEVFFDVAELMSELRQIRGLLD